MRTDFSDRFHRGLLSTLKEYDPNQPRDRRGRWSKIRGAGAGAEEDVKPAKRLPMSWIPPHVTEVSSAIRKAGGRPLLVGGCVRDAMMDIKAKDYDLEVYGLAPDKLEAALSKLGKVDAVGKSFGILKLTLDDVDLDVSVPRRESKVGPGHKGFLPQPDPTMTVTEAARRRDFTMNALAMDPFTGDVYDPFGGIQDIKDRVIKVTDPKTFGDDPLRVLRGAQFAARFGMEIDPATQKLCRDMRESLRELPAERVGGEWKKLLFKSEKPSLGLEAMRGMGVLEVLHPEIQELAGTEQDPKWHPEGDVFEHTKMVLDEATEQGKDLPEKDRRAVIYAALMHDIAKPETTEEQPDGRITSHGHEKAGEKKARPILINQFDLDHATAEKASKLVGNHLAPMMLYQRRGEITDSAIRRLAKRIAPATIESLGVLSKSDNFGRTSPKALARKSPEVDWLLQRAKELEVDREPPKPILMGRHLISEGIMKPGPDMGRVLGRVFEMQMDGKVKNLPEAMAAARAVLEETA